MIKKRIEVLDSLRGFAAFQVVFLHFLSGFDLFSYFQKGVGFYLVHSPLSFFWSGPPAVLLFFVLSGFVLSIPFYSGSSSAYLPYFFKRLIRLYLPCAAIITVSLVCYHMLYTSVKLEGYGAWLAEIWSQPMVPEYVRNVYLLNTFYINIDPALWTLPVEIKLSLLLPFFLYVIKKANKFWSYASILIYMCFYHFLVHIHVIEQFPFLLELYYFTFFITGSLLCKYRDEFVLWFDQLPSSLFYLLFVLAVLIYTSSSTIWWLSSNLQDVVRIRFGEYIAGIAAVLLIGFGLSSRFHALLSSSLLLWLGKVSFSLYLTHMVVIAAVVCLFDTYKSKMVVLPVAAVAVFLFALLFYNLVEVPSMQLAKKIASAISVKKDDRKMVKHDKK